MVFCNLIMVVQIHFLLPSWMNFAGQMTKAIFGLYLVYLKKENDQTWHIFKINVAM